MNELRVLAGTPNRPLVIDDISIPCYVLEGEIRVLSQRGLFQAIGAQRGGRTRLAGNGGDETPRFLATNVLKPFVPEELTAALNSPLVFVPPGGGRTVYGYQASILVDICRVVLSAEEAGAITSRQRSFVRNARALLLAVAKTGTDALVDEVTGYQEIRAKDALRKLLSRHLSDELQEWTLTFQFEFYELMFELKGWHMDPMTQRPSVVGRYTNDLVYDRLGPEFLAELRRRNPVVDRRTGRRRHKHHQWFNREYGHPELVRRLDGIIALMRASQKWDEFKYLMDHAYPKQHGNVMFPFPYDRSGREYAS